jgi:hypothetical protein
VQVLEGCGTHEKEYVRLILNRGEKGAVKSCRMPIAQWTRSMETPFFQHQDSSCLPCEGRPPWHPLRGTQGTDQSTNATSASSRRAPSAATEGYA